MRTFFQAPRRALTFAVLLLTLSGCLWLRYEAMARMHGELLGDYADGAASVVAADVTPDDGYLRTLEYPLLRARDFVRRAKAGLGARPSLEVLDELVLVYGQIYEAMVPLRKQAPSPQAKAEIARLAASATSLSEALEQALLQE